MADPSLLLLLDEVRERTIRRLNSVPAEDARWAPTGLQNSAIWHAGHAYVLLECLTTQALGQSPRLPEGWFEMFGWDSHPDLVPADRWPSPATVIDQLEKQHERMSRLIGKVSAAQLDRPSASHPDESVRRAIIHALHDEACHSGEIYLLRKLRAVRKRRTE